jgi:hypothetical protein
MGIPMDGAAIQEYLEEIEAKIAAKQHQIDEQREVIVKLESAGRTADHAKYLLAGLELLQAAYRDSRSGMLAEVLKFQTEHPFENGVSRSFLGYVEAAGTEAAELAAKHYQPQPGHGSPDDLSFDDVPAGGRG